VKLAGLKADLANALEPCIVRYHIVALSLVWPRHEAILLMVSTVSYEELLSLLSGSETVHPSEIWKMRTRGAYLFSSRERIRQVYRGDFEVGVTAV
jgi:hypothetical protein